MPYYLCHIFAAQCVLTNNGNSLPSFSDYGRNVDRIERHHQAIVPSYRFVCCGNITEWGVDVQPGGGKDLMTYTFDFQVWRPSPTVSTTGCYSLVGNNRFTSISLTDSRVITLTWRPHSISTWRCAWLLCGRREAK